MTEPLKLLMDRTENNLPAVPAPEDAKEVLDARSIRDVGEVREGAREDVKPTGSIRADSRGGGQPTHKRPPCPVCGNPIGTKGCSLKVPERELDQERPTFTGEQLKVAEPDLEPALLERLREKGIVL